MGYSSGIIRQKLAQSSRGIHGGSCSQYRLLCRHFYNRYSYCRQKRRDNLLYFAAASYYRRPLLEYRRPMQSLLSFLNPVAGCEDKHFGTLVPYRLQKHLKAIRIYL